MKKYGGMTSITLEFEEKNPIAQSVIKMIRTLNVFKISKVSVFDGTDEISEEMEKEGFLYTSKINAAKNFEKYL